MSVLTALEEMTRQQVRLRSTLDKIVRKENREEVKHLLELEETDVEDDKYQPTSSSSVINGRKCWCLVFILAIYYSGLFMGSEHEQIGRRGNQKKKMVNSSSQRLPRDSLDCSCLIHANQLHLIVQDADQTPKLLNTSCSAKNEKKYFHLTDQKKAAIRKLEKIIGCRVSEEKHLIKDDIIGCDVDGFLNDDTIIIVKIINSEASLEQRANTETDFCLRYSDDRLTFNTDHQYYYEAQAALELSDRSQCYFVISVRSNQAVTGAEEKEWHYQIVLRNSDLWNRVILPRLETYTSSK